MIRTALVVAALTVGLATAEATTFNTEPVSVSTTQTTPPTTAQATSDKCKPNPKKKRKWRAKKKKKTCPKPDIYILQPCLCRGQQGPIGPRGLPGKTVYKGPDISLGYMGLGMWPKNSYAWAHGPSLRLTSPLTDQKDLSIELGWAIGRDRAVMGHVAVTHWFEKRNWLGLSGGLFGQVIGLRSSRDTGYYGGITPQVAVRTSWKRLGLKANVGPVLGLAGFDNSDTDIVGGLMGSANLSYRW